MPSQVVKKIERNVFNKIIWNRVCCDGLMWNKSDNISLTCLCDGDEISLTFEWKNTKNISVRWFCVIWRRKENIWQDRLYYLNPRSIYLVCTSLTAKVNRGFDKSSRIGHKEKTGEIFSCWIIFHLGWDHQGTQISSGRIPFLALHTEIDWGTIEQCNPDQIAFQVIPVL